MLTYKNASTYYIIVELEILKWYLAALIMLEEYLI